MIELHKALHVKEVAEGMFLSAFLLIHILNY